MILIVILLAFRIISSLASKPSNLRAKSSCDLYLAPSSIAENGLGVFAATDFKVGETIGEASVAIPWIDEISDDNNNTISSLSVRMLREFLFDSSEIGGFGEANKVSLFLPGAPSLVQHHPSLENVAITGLKADENGRHTHSSHPMAGSFSRYHSVSLIAKTKIRKGQELFLDRHNHPQQGPSRADFQAAELIVEQFSSRMDQLDLTTAQWTDLFYRIRTDLMPNKQVAELLPRSEFELKRAFRLGLPRSKLQDRSMSWVRQNGICLDHIRQDQSTTIQQRGLFASKSLPKDSVIMTSPLVPVNQSSLLLIDKEGHNNSQQLLINYCLGHRQSTTLLCPTASVALINHASTSAKSSPNVKLKWREETNSLLQGSLEEFWNQISRKNMLMMEYIALRDIEEDEELLLDYGSEWEIALGVHRNRQVDDDRPLVEESAHQYNTRIQASTDTWPLTKSLPHYLRYECHVYPELMLDETRNQWEEYHSNRMVDSANWPLDRKLLYKDNHYSGWYPCEIVAIQDHANGGTYSVHLFRQQLHNTDIGRRFRSVPRNRIRVTEGPYQSDQHLPWSFRYPIQIGDEIFPLRWRNDYKTASHWNLGAINAEEKFSEAVQEEYEQSIRKAKCGVYMAVSNIPNAGFGTYASVDIPARGVTVGSTIPEIPVRTAASWAGSEYVWQAFGLEDDCPSILRGLFGSIANSHTGITNMIAPPADQHTKYDPILDRRKDHGAGAFSPYFSNRFVSAYPVRKGEELFVTYGEHWFRNRNDYADVPLKEHFRRADNSLASIWSMLILEGAGLFDAHLVLKANQDKFNEKYHKTKNSRYIATCKGDFNIDQLPPNMEAFVLRSPNKPSKQSNMPSSVAARAGKSKTYEFYQGISFSHKNFQLPKVEIPGDGTYYPCEIVSGDQLEGTLEVIIFLNREDKRVILKYSDMPSTLLHFRIIPHSDGLKALVDLFREHLMKDFDPSGVISDSYRRTRTALLNVHTLDDIQTIFQRNGTAMATIQPRSDEWMEENGFCLDHVYVNTSTIEQAGNGAFSRRFLPKDSLVIGTPLLAAFRDDSLMRIPGESTRKSLIYNYHFGHKNSSVLWFPVSTVVAINHNSKTMPNGQESNARVQFSKKDKKSRYLVHRPLEDIRKEKYSSMVLEVIATRDIEPDEEIFVDYGKDWERAWKELARNWVNPCANVAEPCYRSSKLISDMNKDKFNTDYHKWTIDHAPYCTYKEKGSYQKKVRIILLSHADQFQSFKSAVESNHVNSYLGITEEHEGFKLEPLYTAGGDRVFACKILESNKEAGAFEVILFERQKAENIVRLFHIQDFPSDSIKFRPRPFKGDMAAQGAFRHEIAIPDDSFPEIWKDLVNI